jgi:hypothetical protein
MKKHGDNLDKAINALKNEPTPPGPPQNLVDETMQKLSRAGSDARAPTSKGKINIAQRIIAAKNLGKVAAVAVLLIAAGYTVGRLTAAQELDAKQLQALESSLKPAIRRDVIDQLNKDWRLVLTSGFTQLKDELNQQFRSEMNQFAIQTLAASGAITNQHLKDLIAAINAAQTQERRWVLAAMEQIEINRLQDKSLFRNSLETLALETDDELRRTREDMARFLTFTQPDSTVPNKTKNLNNSNERSKQ